MRVDSSPVLVADGLELFKFELIVARQAVAITAGVHGNGARPDITTVPLEGVEPSYVLLASRAGDRSRLVATFRKLAEAHITGPDAAGPGRA
jgi:hypothetical protein